MLLDPVVVNLCTTALWSVACQVRVVGNLYVLCTHRIIEPREELYNLLCSWQGFTSVLIDIAFDGNHSVIGAVDMDNGFGPVWHTIPENIGVN